MINLFQPNVGDEAISILGEVFSKNWLGRGEYSDRFETSLSDILKVERDKITTMSCCTDAIFAILAVLRQTWSVRKRYSSLKLFSSSRVVCSGKRF